ncbi:alpha/beta-hydrolase [Hypoxylon sp. NC1633]|nr:alpha/beta-hydrolase [Hypoxylon sp. NC1633]
MEDDGAKDSVMQYAYCKANDGCTLAFQTSQPLRSDNDNDNGEAPATETTPYQNCIILIHGFSGSSEYFARNFDELSRAHWVVAPDLRGHGRSGRPRGGYHVARLAADLRDLLAHLRLRAPSSTSTSAPRKIVAVGCSIGAAVLWTHVELFGGDDFAGFVFVDQAPLQDRSDDWGPKLAHLGCYDEATMRAAQEAWTREPEAALRGLVKDCLGYRHAPEAGDDLSDERRQRDEAFFCGIGAKCDPAWLARLLADHTRYDHREAIEEIRVPTLVMAGRRTGCFTLEGMRETVRRVEMQRPGLAWMSVFNSGHWLFYEEPERFNRELIKFFHTPLEASLPTE